MICDHFKIIKIEVCPVAIQRGEDDRMCLIVRTELQILVYLHFELRGRAIDVFIHCLRLFAIYRNRQLPCAIAFLRIKADAGSLKLKRHACAKH